MSKKIVSLSALIILLLLPILILAQVNVGTLQPPPIAFGTPPNNPIVGVMNNIINYVIWPIVIGVTIILFIMAGLSFLTSRGEPGKLDQAKNFLIWGSIGVVIILISFSIIATVKWILGL